MFAVTGGPGLTGSAVAAAAVAVFATEPATVLAGSELLSVPVGSVHVTGPAGVGTSDPQLSVSELHLSGPS